MRENLTHQVLGCFKRLRGRIGGWCHVSHNFSTKITTKFDNNAYSSRKYPYPLHRRYWKCGRMLGGDLKNQTLIKTGISGGRGSGGHTKNPFRGESTLYGDSLERNILQFVPSAHYYWLGLILFTKMWNSLILHFQYSSFISCQNLLISNKCSWYIIPSDTELYSTSAVSVLWWCIERCWEDSVYIQALCHRFWKLTLQVKNYGTVETINKVTIKHWKFGHINRV